MDCFTAGMMNLVQMSSSESDFFIKNPAKIEKGLGL
jgi:hypothetical protein